MTLTAFPASHVAGDTLIVERTSYAGVPVGAGWEVKLTLIDVAGAKVEATAAESGAAYQFVVDASEWAALKAGPLTWAVTAVKDGVRMTAESAVLSLLPDPTNAANGATSRRAHIERVIAACEARLEGKITDDVQMYQLPDGVTVSRMSLRDVQALLNDYRSQRARLLRGGKPRVREVWYGRR